MSLAEAEEEDDDEAEPTPSLLEAPSQFLHLLLCLLPAFPRLIFVARDSERADSTLGTVPWKCAMAWHKKIDCHGCHATKFFYAMTALRPPTHPPTKKKKKKKKRKTKKKRKKERKRVGRREEGSLVFLAEEIPSVSQVGILLGAEEYFLDGFPILFPFKRHRN